MITKFQDELLCFCNQVDQETFRHAVWTNPAVNFFDLCARFSVGTKCTACLLNAEAFYLDAYRSKPLGPIIASTGQTRKGLSLRRRFWNLLDLWAPRIPIGLGDRAPVLAARHVRTKLTIANSVAAAIGPQSSRFLVILRRYLADGTLYKKETFRLGAGERLDVTVSDGLIEEVPSDLLVVGSCEIRRKGLDDLYRGTTRPHFTVETDVAASTVHTQGSEGKFIAGMLTANDNEAERQFAVMMNCTDKPADITVQVMSLDQLDQRVVERTTVAGRGTALVYIPFPSRGKTTGLYAVEFITTRRVKTYYGVSTEDGHRISMDHL